MDTFRKLTNKERKEFVVNVMNQGGEWRLFEMLSINQSVMAAFDWSNTTQGHSYWSAINRRIVNSY